MKSARNALLLATLATLGLVGIGADLQPATALPAPAAVLAQSQGYTEQPLTIDSQSPKANLAGVYRRKITIDGLNYEWDVAKTNDGKYVLLTNLSTSGNTHVALTPDGECVKYH